MPTQGGRMEINMNIQDTRPIIKKSSHDVIVVGGGIAGVSAAVEAARNGSDVLLIEKSIILGGLATAGLISWYEPLCDSCGKQMIGGISEELIRLSIKYGFDSMHEDWKNKKEGEKQGRYTTFFSPNMMTLALDEYIQENGVKLLFDCLAVFPVVENNIVKGVVCETKEGKIYYECKVIIDATGDASVYATAGAPTVDGENYLSCVVHSLKREDIENYIESGNMQHMRKWILAGSTLAGDGHPEGYPHYAGLNADEITDFVLSGRKLLLDKIRDEDRNMRDIATLPTMPQFRTIRHIVGEYTFVANDRETFDNAIGSCGDFRKRFWGYHYQIPYTSLYNKEFKNMFAAGRVIDAHGEGWEASRVIPVAALTGQAAGCASAMCVKYGTSNHDVDVSLLQATLKKEGVLFEV